MRLSVAKAILVAAVLGLSPAAAFPVAAQSAPIAAQAEPNCTCRYAGRSYAAAACVCLITPNGPRLACCGKVLNNSSWNFNGDACPTAAAPGSGPTDQLARSAVQTLAAQGDLWAAAPAGQ